MSSTPDKDDVIIRVLDRLRHDLGAGAFDVVDHWEADLNAVGIASPKNHGVLVYISTSGQSEERYHVELELPPAPGDDFPYQDAGSFSQLDYPQLLDIVRQHLGRA
jgi:hypothetical protein